MAVDKEQIKKKIYEKLPDLLPKLLKTVIVHIVMMLYHISMPPWVTVLKVKKEMKSYKNTKEAYPEEAENNRRLSHRRTRRLKRRHRQI